ncbi:hypothetical protein GCM10023235_11710 [Kitasatospora terrestris]|uniref:Uncharacterized protein n=1 Tax=Kitasatospora terrestris TaxID=258051 RepID=A0ABP9DH71_9ACTN
MQEQEDAPGVLFVREAMGRVAGELVPPPGMTLRAVREGRRRRLRSRLAIGGAVLGTAVLASFGLTAVLGTGTGPGSGGAGTVPLAAGDGTPARVFPTVRLSPTASPPPTASPSASGGTNGERVRVEAFRQRTAAVLQDLLPPGVGGINLIDDQVSGYLGKSPQGSYFIRFSVRPAPNGPRERTCPAGAPGKLGTCTLVELPDGASASVQVVPEGDGTVTLTRASFHFGGSDVSVSVSPDDSTGGSAPVTADQMAGFVLAPRVLDLVQEADLHPVESPGVSYDEGANQ